MRAWPVGFGILLLVACGVAVAIALRPPDTVVSLPEAKQQPDAGNPSSVDPSQAHSRLSGAGRLRVSLIGAPRSPLEVSVESASETPIGLGKTVLTPGSGQASWSIDVPPGTPCRVLVSRAPDSPDGSFRACAILPIIADVEPLVEGDEREAAIDFSKLPRMSVALQGEAAKLTRVVWHFDTNGAKEAHDSVLEPVGGRFEIVAAAPGSASFEGVGLGIRGMLRLVDNDKRRSFQLEPRTEHAALWFEFGEVGSLAVEENGRRVSFAYGTGGTMSELGTSHVPVSLGELKDIGATDLSFLTSEGSYFSIPVLGLNVDARGEIVVQTPRVSNRVTVTANGDVPDHWCPWITDAEHGAIPLAKQDAGWCVQGLTDGRHALYWIGPPLHRVPIRSLELPTSTGERSITVTATPPSLLDSRVVVENWTDLPQDLQRGTLYVENMPNTKPPKAGVFSYKLARPLAVYQQVGFMANAALGVIPCRVEAAEDEMRVRMDLSKVGRVKFVTRLGGQVTVQCRNEQADLRGQSRGAFRTVRSTEGGSEFVSSGEPAFVRFWEGNQSSKVPNYRGTFRLENGATIADPGGRFLLGVNETNGPIVVRVVERFDRECLETPIGIYETGSVSVWLPASATEIIVESMNGTRRFPATVASLLVSPTRR